ncbi:ABC transporter ATP-binding protein [Microbispora hainanensis]|jgi:molybdate transport system ATP-binding protein|uniref:ABC transporter ATP-binding protein n=1 Tax=Microbispora hainanensis TaxID=568844 RepID=A0ABZ1SIM9_9ACTN|nr:MULTISPECIES: ABC transporter ATP-binding protein [Microbispora]NJP26651.1 ABC transporter ATP-binding protein [Microbispora sp. CL1-1]TQS12151.1 ABC transporter ATP-binding protein [Microbispora sp. SCL1-1]
MSVKAHLVVERPAFRLDLRISAAAGEVVALLGPNGAGKTTALRALAGLTALNGGRVELDGAEVHHLPPERRGIGVVFQDYLLFPHLSALDNVAFGPRCQGLGKAAARRVAAELLDRVGLAGHAHVRPGRLSGGQAQRVALARALAVRPRLLLLDEPLAALDAHTRLEIRAELRRHLADFDGATILVTHDALDAMVLAHRLVVIENGAVVQTGTPSEIARHPRTDYVARLVGLNLYRGQADGDQVVVGEVRFSSAERLTGPAFVAFPPSAVALYRSRPDGSPRNLWQAVIDGIERHGDHVRVHLRGPIPLLADVTPAAAADLDLTPGRDVWAAVKATETHAYPA